MTPAQHNAPGAEAEGVVDRKAQQLNEQRGQTSSATAPMDYAVAMAELGYHVHPCRIVLDADGKKRPYGLPGNWQAAGLTSRSDIELVWRSISATGYLIACGPSGVTGLDLDVRPEVGVDGRRSWAEAGGPRGMFVVSTGGGGGEHHYFASTGAGNGTGGLPGVDVKGIGGGLFGPGSEVVDAEGVVTGRYVVLEGNPARPGLSDEPPLPEAVHAGPKGVIPPGSFFNPPKSASAAARQWDGLHHRFVAGLRHHGAHGWGEEGHRFVLACTRELAGLSPQHARAAFADWFAQAGLVPTAADEAKLESALTFPADIIVADLPPPTAPHDTSRVGTNFNYPSSNVSQANDTSRLSAAAPGPRRLPMIGDAVWNHYGWTRSIRAQARARRVCPDAVLGAMLATYAAKVPPSVRVETGVKMALGTNLVVSLVGPSGSDKSSAFRLAQQIAPGSAVPVISNPNSGESFAASFTHADPNFEGSAAKAPRVLKDDPRALFYVAEGGMIAGVGSRNGSTWLPHLRALAMDEALSTTNATSEINRQVPDGSYSAGLVVGFQTTTAMTILEDTATGTAQRFLWFTALSSEDYGAVPLGAPMVPMSTPLVTRLAERIDAFNNLEHVLTCVHSITTRLVAEQDHDRMTRDLADTDDHDAHRHVLVAKLAALGCLSDGRVMVDESDWSWAEALYASSAATRDELLGLAAERADDEVHAAAARAGTSDRVRRGYDASVVRVAGVLVAKVQRDGPQKRGYLNRVIAGRDRHYLTDAIEYANTQGWQLLK